MSNHMTWSELCDSDEYRGRWVALDQCRYCEQTAKPLEGTVVDADDDLVELCNRIRAAGSRDCAIHFIEAPRTPAPSSVRAFH
jgi:hypothetical protein